MENGALLNEKKFISGHLEMGDSQGGGAEKRLEGFSAEPKNFAISSTGFRQQQVLCLTKHSKF